MEILTLIDNLVYGEGLTAEHGLSFLIKVKNKTILFDTGQTGAIVHNANYLAEDLNDVDAVVISHGHYDHCGGLESFLAVNSHATIYLKQRALSEKYSVHGSIKKFVGFSLKKPLDDYPNSFVFLDEDTEIFPGVKLITEIFDYTHDLVAEGDFFEKSDMKFLQDPFADELFMLINERNKNHLFTGCSHKGILNILKTAYEKLNHRKIDSVSGGMHFGGALLDQLDQHIDRFEVFGIEKLYLNHCTGIDGYLRLKNKFPLAVQYAFTGYHYELY